MAVSDDFNRASLGAGWTHAVAGKTHSISTSTEIQGDSSGTSATYWNAVSFANDQTAIITIGSVGGSGNYIGAAVRITTNQWYALITEASGGWFLYSVIGGATSTIIASGDYGTCGSGDTFEILATGTGIVGKRNGTNLGTGTNSQIASGSAGVASLSAPNSTRATHWAATGDSGGGPTVHTGTVAMAGTGGLVITGLGAYLGALAMSGTGTLAVTGTAAYKGVVAMSGTGSQTVTGTRATLGQLAFSNVSDMTVTSPSGTVHNGSLVMEGLGALLAAGARAVAGVLSMAGAGSMTVAGIKAAVGQVVMGGTGGMTVTATMIAKGVVTMVGMGTMTVRVVGATLWHRVVEYFWDNAPIRLFPPDKVGD